jgi:uroporphyrinogen-III decarboxylase
VFNLGWGVLPETDPDVLKRVVDLVHSRAAEAPSGGQNNPRSER